MSGPTSSALRPSTTRLFATLAAVLLGALTGAAAVAAPASAHTALRSSSPADGAVLTTSPGEVRLEFNERPAATRPEVAVTLDGRVVRSGPARTDGAAVVTPVSLPGPGAYTVAYRVVAGDGHPVQGLVRFRVAGTPGRAVTPSTGPTEVAKIAPRASASPTALVPPPPDTSRWPYLVIALVVLILVGIAIVLLTGERRPKRPRF
jgi:methionine-rich copper-binding protein CopC